VRIERVAEGGAPRDDRDTRLLTGD
jgi:hypothetical protein